jgi:hypothetical protein
MIYKPRTVTVEIDGEPLAVTFRPWELATHSVVRAATTNTDVTVAMLDVMRTHIVSPEGLADVVTESDAVALWIAMTSPPPKG